MPIRKREKKAKATKKPEWVLYILECGDKTFYTGITNDLERRLNAHTTGKGAKYTKGRGPLKVIYSEAHKNRSKASKREAEVKSLNKEEKLLLVVSGKKTSKLKTGQKNRPEK